MPQDRINLLEAKLSSTSTAGSMPNSSRASLPTGESSSSANSNSDLHKSMDKLKKLSTIIDLQIAPAEKEAFDGRLENMEPLKAFIMKKMKNVASNFGVTDGKRQAAQYRKFLKNVPCFEVNGEILSKHLNLFMVPFERTFHW